mgnify:CR=1 FL=1|jgi:hypothetical protein|tara:strand:- start:338 stop:766 length:429 start_codon:yes stop_codon:yes gene_type:complete
MANIIPFAFRGELFTGTHNFASGGDSFKFALYTANPYDTASTVYSATNEVSSAGGSNYTTTGNTLTGNAVAYSTAVASCDFADTEWTSATITAAYGAIYNDTQSDKLCVVLDFSGSKSCTNGTFKISFPNPATPADAIISMA